jgi:hypothetical protein
MPFIQGAIQKLGLTDKLTLVRHVILSFYGWVLSPVLITHLPKIQAGMIMLSFTILIAFIFLKISGKKRENSVFISFFTFLWKVIFFTYKNVMISYVIKFEENIRKGKKPISLNLVFVNIEPFVSGTLLILEPFLFLVKYRNGNYTKEQGNVIDAKLWLLIIISNLLATITWMIFTFFVGLKLYRFLGILT